MKLERCKKHINLFLQEHTILRVPCCNCGGTEYIEDMYADLDGKPFESYYCEKCSNEL
tara:strand:+ start:536 stop:709 length:174 start_codon:yes stop_codon:yes gene_type:complete